MTKSQWLYPFNASALLLESNREWWVRNWPPFPPEWHHSGGVPSHIVVPWSTNTFPENPIILRSFQILNVGTSSMMMGVLMLKIIHTLCVLTPQNTRNNKHNYASSKGVTRALLLSAFLLMVAAAIESFVLPIIGLDRGTDYRLIALARSWIRLLGILLMCAIAHKRALSIKFSWPQIVFISKCFSFSFVFISLITRSMSTVYEIQMVISDVQPSSAIFASQLTRTVLLLASAIYFIFMEGLVTALVFWNQDGQVSKHALDTSNPFILQQQPRSLSKKQWRRQCCGTPLARYRNILSVCIVMVFISQALFQLHTFSSSVLFTPYYGNAWTLFLVRLFDFRFELESRFDRGHDLTHPPFNEPSSTKSNNRNSKNLTVVSSSTQKPTTDPNTFTIPSPTYSVLGCTSPNRLLPRDDFIGYPMLYKSPDYYSTSFKHIELMNKMLPASLLTSDPPQQPIESAHYHDKHEHEVPVEVHQRLLPSSLLSSSQVDPPTLQSAHYPKRDRAVPIIQQQQQVRIARELLRDVSNQRWDPVRS